MTGLGDRTKYVGGSDIHHIFNLPPYGCTAWLWDEKRGEAPDYPQEINKHMYRGTVLEPLVIDEFYHRQGKIYTGHAPAPAEFRLGNICGHPDHIVSLKDRQCVLECKVASVQIFRQLKAEGAPEHWILQLNLYLGLTKHQHGVFVVLCCEPPYIWEIIEIPLEFNQELFNETVAGCEKFWRQVENGPRPDRLDPTDKRCKRCNRRNSCQGDIMSLIPLEVSEGDLENETQNAAFEQFANDYIEAVKLEREIKEFKANAEAQIKAIIGDRPGAYNNNLKVHFKPQVSKRWDTKRLGKDHPTLKEKYQIEIKSRPFRAYILTGE